MDEYIVTGIMSGTSLDGIDLACCLFTGEHPRWKYEILAAETIPYSGEWKNKLVRSGSMGGEELSRLHVEYGRLLGDKLRKFHHDYDLKPQFAVSHGHTVYHQPAKGLTLQIGHGATIAARAGIPVINDMRGLDVALGGQGAPLVPMGDHFLFREYDYCLNLGGFANISYLTEAGTRVAFDICPANIVLNQLAESVGQPYDHDGKMARKGHVLESLLEELHHLPYYSKDPPKSLGREWVEENITPLMEKSNAEAVDLLRTYTEHIAMQVMRVARGRSKQILITGGGAKNRFLIEQMRSDEGPELVVPDSAIIDFKEALVFAFLGVLRWLRLPNVYASVTGAYRDSCGGAIHLP